MIKFVALGVVHKGRPHGGGGGSDQMRTIADRGAAGVEKLVGSN